ncbi:CAP domain-containing protein [Desulfobulbus alkaliphilus]|uniref:CAP domain-containing protein n=1 Tax=Desulfobulbus alkaliphilus TaxID=869814 RepID=UPI00196536AF|nr:CAP domain-containing protein [Desulfobulbus alkaliphilus]MBM9536911.1 CAP domain-containing protein [Desulfobulbus alkaliphilus]
MKTGKNTPGKRLLWGALLTLSLSIMPMTSAGSSSLYGRTLLELINTHRQEHGLHTLRTDAGLHRLARQHSFEMFRQQRINHLGFRDRFDRAGSTLCVENVGGGHTNARQQFEAWRNSSPHNQNMLHNGIQKAGIVEINNYVTFFACR